MSIPGLIVASIIFLAGLAGTVLPILPGELLIFTGMLVYGFFVDFRGGFNLLFFLGQGMAVLLVFLVDYFAGIWGTKKFGGSKAAVLGSVAGVLLGVITLGPFGIIIGPFAGAFIGEFIYNHDLEIALKAGLGTLVGFMGGTMVKLLIEVTMIIWFFIVVF